MTRKRWHAAYVGIGSNLDSPADQVKNAIGLLRELPEASLISASGLYQSAPLLGQEQPDYINAVAAMLTQKNARDFFHQLQSLENKQGRVRSEQRWAARVLDLDLLAFGQQQSTEDDLILPHPGIAMRNFVLLPWREISPEYVVPGIGSVARLAVGISRDEPRIQRLN